MTRYVQEKRSWATWRSQMALMILSSLCSCAVATSRDQAEVMPTGDATLRLGIQLGHRGGLELAVFSRDGRSVLTASTDWTARLWDVATGKELQRFNGHTDTLGTAQFAPDGRTILTGSHDHTARLWDVITGKELQRFTGHDASVNSAVFSQDGTTVLTASADGTTRLWDVTTGLELQRLSGRVGWVQSAVFSLNGHSVLTANIDGTARLWDVAAGKEQQRFVGHRAPVNSAVFAPDETKILTASDDGTTRLWDVATGKELQWIPGHEGEVNSAVFGADGRSVLTASSDGTARLWDVATNQELHRFTGHGTSVRSAVFGPDGHTILTAGVDGTARQWDMATGKELQRFVGRVAWVQSAVFSLNGHSVLTANIDGTARLWDVAAGKEQQWFVGHSGPVNSTAFALDGQKLLTSSSDETARLWDVVSGEELQRFTGHSGEIMSAVFVPNGRAILTASEDRTARLWDLATGKELRRFEGHGGSVSSAVSAPDGRMILTASSDKTARLWDLVTGKELHRFEGHGGSVSSAVFAPDGRMILTASSDKTARLWDLVTGKELRRFEGHGGEVISAVFARNGRTVLTAAFDGTARLWEVATGQELRQFEYGGWIQSASFSPDEHTVLTTGSDGIAQLWDVVGGKRMADLVSFTDGTWVVTTPDGRFDTNNLEEVKGLHWIMPDDPLRPLSLEIFMRDYYEPRLLPRVLAKEQFSPLPSLVTLNRAQPKVDIQKIQVVEEKTGVVTVSVKVTSDQAEVTREGKQVAMQSGAYDLRLFRNGQLVGQFPVPKDEQIPGEQTREQELAQWRQRHEIHHDPATGKKIVTFHGIRLPRQASVQEVEFTAYAFNVDRVKSATARRKFKTPKGMILRQGRAYVVTVGINGFESDLMNRLSYAANDAKRLSAELSDRLKAVKDPDSGKPVFGEANVVSIALVAEFGAGEQAGQLTVNHATKYRIKAVIDKLAGKPSDAALLKDIPHAEQLQLAQPEDLVVLAFSTHGDTDQQGQFYLMPYDLGTSTESSDIRKHAISSDELSGWLRSMDAGEMVMIVDACHSAGAVESQEFKPGPMGSRGLGQLAFDKGMRILAASQRDQYALETEKTQQGLLSYSLVREGLREQAADFQPKDGRIQLAEWLNYGVTRVPGLYQDYRTGKLKARAATPLDQREGKRFISIQEPALFDFARGRDMSLVIGVGR